MQLASSSPIPARRTNRNRSVAFFLVLFLLGAAAVTVPVLYNLSLQLTPDQVERARRLWEANGPPDYNLQIQMRSDMDEKTDYFIEVRGGRVVNALCNGEPDTSSDSAHYTVSELLAHIETTLRKDREAGGKRNYAMADFDTRDGHPRRYVRRIAGTHERTEWIIRMTPPDVPEDKRGP